MIYNAHTHLYRANTDLQFKHRVNEQKSIYDSLMLRTKEKDKDAKLVHTKLRHFLIIIKDRGFHVRKKQGPNNYCIILTLNCLGL